MGAVPPPYVVVLLGGADAIEVGVELGRHDVSGVVELVVVGGGVVHDLEEGAAVAEHVLNDRLGVEDLEEEAVREVGLLVLKRANSVNERLVGARGEVAMGGDGGVLGQASGVLLLSETTGHRVVDLNVVGTV